MKAAIITEGLQGTGYGHLTRCLSIYQAFEEKDNTPLYIANCDEVGKKFIPNVNLLQLNWIENTDGLVEHLKDFDIAVIDSYLATLEIYNKIYKTVKKIVCIDDYIRLDYPPGVIINGTIGAENLPYKKDDKHMYLLGIDYMPLRKEFWDIEIPQKHTNNVKNVLITFGGQDFRELTFPVLDFILSKYPGLNYNVVKGINKNNTQSKVYGNNVTFYTSLNAKEMLELILKCDLAITSAGQISYELNRVGLQSILIGVIENQKYNIEGWLENGYIHNKIWHNEVNIIDKIMRDFDIHIDIYERKLRPQDSAIVDGQGARRLVNILKK